MSCCAAVSQSCRHVPACAHASHHTAASSRATTSLFLLRRLSLHPFLVPLVRLVVASGLTTNLVTGDVAGVDRPGKASI
jgi:hypothetical protein